MPLGSVASSFLLEEPQSRVSPRRGFRNWSIPAELLRRPADLAKETDGKAILETVKDAIAEARTGDCSKRGRVEGRGGLPSRGNGDSHF